MPAIRLIRQMTVTDMTGLRRSTIYKYVAENNFPKPVPLGGGRVAWVEQEVQDWIMERIEARDAT
jgi:prophage regulatory protein